MAANVNFEILFRTPLADAEIGIYSILSIVVLLSYCGLYAMACKANPKTQDLWCPVAWTEMHQALLQALVPSI